MRTRFQGLQELFVLCVLLTLTACGGGGGGTTPPSHADATLTYPSGTQTFTVGTAITPLAPTITGSLTSFSVSPSLPVGLSLDAGTGVISGTPTAVTTTRTCTVTGTGANGATASATVTVTINDVSPSQVSYGATSFTYTAGYAGSTLTPKAAGGSIIGWSISPALPQGLSFDATNGSIAGTPTTATASASYVVTAQNSGGTGSVSLTIAVNAASLIHLGHQGSVVQVRATAANVLSADALGQWILWDYTGHTVIATGNSNCTYGVNACPVYSAAVDLKGTTAAVVVKAGFELHSTTDGHTLGTIATSALSWWMLATDGSYLAAGNSTGVSAWSPSGQLLFSNSGDYSKAAAFAAPGQLLIGGGAAGANVIETIAVPSGTSSTGPSFNGTFSSWFLDGGQFISLAGTTALVYTSAGAPEGSITGVTAYNVVGQGNWVWTFSTTGGVLNIYPTTGTNSSTAPVASYTFNYDLPQVAGSGTTIGVAGPPSTPFTPSTINVIDLSGATPVETNYTANLRFSGAFSSSAYAPYAAVSASHWVMGDSYGVLVDGATLATTPSYFGFGQVTGTVGGSAHFAIATASGTILYFNSATLAQEGQIALRATRLQMSSDGTVLAAVGDGTFTGTNPVQIYSLPAGSLVYSWPYTAIGDSGGTDVFDIELSGTGTVLGQELEEATTNSQTSSYVQSASAATGGMPIFSSTASSFGPEFYPTLRISPDSTLIAYSQGGSTNVGTNLLLNGSLVTAFSGLPAGWLDNSRLLVNNYENSPSVPAIQYAGCTLYGPNGVPTGAPCAIGIELQRFQSVTSDGIYAPQNNQIFSVSTGATTWASGDPIVSNTQGAVAGSNVIFISGIDALAQPF